MQGSAEAIVSSLEKLGNEEVRARIIHSGAGGITESDVLLAKGAGCPILGFNVRASAQARQLAEREGVEIRYYAIIYDLLDDMKGVLSGMLSPIQRETWLGNAALLGGAALWATYTVRVRWSGLSPVQAAALVCLISLVVYVPAYALSGVQRLTEAPLAEVLLHGLYQGCVIGGLAVVAFNQAVARLGAGSAAAIVSLVPVMAALLGVAVLGEIPTPLAAVAIVAIAVGVFLAAGAPAARPGTT